MSESSTPSFPEVVPLSLPQSSLPRFPVDALPPVFCDYVKAVATSTQTSPDMAAAIALGVLATCLQGKRCVQLASGHTEPLSLYVCVIAPPGERKSSVMRAMTQDIRDYEQWYKAAHEDDLTPRRLIADDTTSEALTRLLAQNQGILSVFSTEGGLFDTLAGRYSNGQANIDTILKAHDGDSIYVDRIGRESEYIPTPTLSITLTVQPSVLSKIMQNDTMSGRGLLARFVYCTPPSTIGSRLPDADPIPDHVREAYAHEVYRMLAIPVPKRPLPLQMTQEAKTLYSELFMAHEQYLVGAGQAIPDWAAKYVGSVLRIAGLLHAATMTSGDFYISGQTMRNAIQIGQYLLAQAEYAYGGQADELVMQKVRFVWARIHSFGTDVVKRSALYQTCRGRFFHKTEELIPVLDILQDRGYIYLSTPPRQGPGRPSDTLIYVNPQALTLG